MSGRRVVIVVLACATVLAACQVDTTTTVRVADDGSGDVTVEVVLDAEAAAEVDGLAEQLRVDDLTDAGWDVVGPDATEDGGVRVVATKPFAGPDAAASVLDEIAGSEVFSGAVQRDTQFGRDEHGFTAALDLSGGIEAFSDDELAALLNDLPIGQDVAALEERLGAPLEELTSFTVVADLPDGDVGSEGDPVVTESSDRRVFTWAAALGEPPTELEARTRQIDWLVLALAAAAAVCLAALALMMSLRLRARRRPTVASTTD